MKKLEIKTPAEVEVMRAGGRILANIKSELSQHIRAGRNGKDIDDLAQKLIKDSGAKPSFMMVRDYKWATCVNVNSGLVHGIPKKETIFQEGDIVSVDVGVYFRGFHTDTSFSKLIGKDQKKERFLEVGEKALNKAIGRAKVGSTIGDISEAMESTLVSSKLTPIRALVGHGIGRELHEDPMVPCYTGYRGQNMILEEGLVLAIEVMYAQGTNEIKLDEDGWTLSMKDGKIAALFEDTVAVTKKGPLVLT